MPAACVKARLDRAANDAGVRFPRAQAYERHLGTRCKRELPCVWRHRCGARQQDWRLRADERGGGGSTEEDAPRQVEHRTASAARASLTRRTR
eukprot:scaffold71468_cov66-Phaeocystis_antarctica.AAC.2